MHKILTALATAAALTLAVVAVPDQADARWRGGHRGYGGGGVAAGIIGGLAAGAILGGIAADQGYYGPGYYGYGGCYVRRLVATPWGPRWRLINRCY